MRRLAALSLSALALAACGGPDSADELDGYAADAEEVRIDYTFDCTRLAQASADPHAGEKLFIRLTSTKAAQGPTAALDPANGGWKFDTHYTSTDRVPYVRYADPANTSTHKRYLKVQKPMRSSGGATMNNGSKGGYALVETSGPGYSFAKYLCFRAQPQTTGGGSAFIRYAAQFVGTYKGTATVSRLVIKRDGTYEATVGGKSETGTVSAPGTLAAAQATSTLFTLRSSTGTSWTANPISYTGTLAVIRGSAHETLTADGFVGPNETLCDDSGGSWTDDDADAATGLYCVCPGAKWYIPSAGGCVN